jgi:hypothetical protein
VVVIITSLLRVGAGSRMGIIVDSFSSGALLFIPFSILMKANATLMVSLTFADTIAAFGN